MGFPGTETPFPMFFFTRIMPMAKNHPWDERYIYLHFVDIYGFHVGRYTMDGWYRMGFSFDSTKVAFPPVPSCEFLSQVSGGRRRHRRQMHHHRHLILPPPRHPRSRQPAGCWKRYSSCGFRKIMSCNAKAKDIISNKSDWCVLNLNAKVWKLRLIPLHTVPCSEWRW